MRIKHRLLNQKGALCKCGNIFYPKNHHKKYCSERCKKEYMKNWNKIRKDFFDSHPNLCNRCGCNNRYSKFKACLECCIIKRAQNKRYYDKLKEKKKMLAEEKLRECKTKTH